jgi:hypothetical protein
MLLQRSMGMTTMGGWLRLAVDGNLARGEHLHGVVVAADATKKTIVSGMKSSVIQAPSTNFATSTTTTVTPVTNAPNPFTRALQPMRAAIFRQCITMPACESVNARNAPTA